MKHKRLFLGFFFSLDLRVQNSIESAKLMALMLRENHFADFEINIHPLILLQDGDHTWQDKKMNFNNQGSKFLAINQL